MFSELTKEDTMLHIAFWIVIGIVIGAWGHSWFTTEEAAVVADVKKL
jgi:hypothetical protein